MVLKSKIRGEKFYDELARHRESQDCTTGCSCISERDGKAKDGLAQGKRARAYFLATID